MTDPDEPLARIDPMVGDEPQPVEDEAEAEAEFERRFAELFPDGLDV